MLGPHDAGAHAGHARAVAFRAHRFPFPALAHLREKIGSGGTLYAAVGPQKISEALARKGFKINKDQIILKPIKEAGEYKAKIKFQHGLEAEISIVVSPAASGTPPHGGGNR